MLYNKSNIPGRPESIGVQTKNFSTLPRSSKNITIYNKVLKSLLEGCKSLEKSGCKFIVIPCNTAHYWYEDLIKKIKVPVINMPKEVFLHTKKICKKNSKIGLLATEGTLKTKIYEKLFKNEYQLIKPLNNLQIESVNKTIKHVKMGNIKLAEKSIKPAINYLIKKNCKKIILGCTELPIAIFAFRSLKNAKISKLYLDPNLILANSSMKKYKRNNVI